MSDSELTSMVLRLSVDCQFDSLIYINYNIIEEVYYYRRSMYEQIKMWTEYKSKIIEVN